MTCMSIASSTNDCSSDIRFVIFMPDVSRSIHDTVNNSSFAQPYFVKDGHQSVLRVLLEACDELHVEGFQQLLE